MNQWNIFLLFLFTFHMKMHLAQETKLSDNPKIFDDQYKGCSSMMNKIIPRILISEKKSNAEFKNGWLMATKRWRKIKDNIKDLPKGFRDEHGIALVAYSSHLYQAFNNASRDVGGSQHNYKKKFHYKAMHYYLTMAIKMLTDKQQKLVYRGVNNLYFAPSKRSKRSIRFGQFTSASEDPAKAKKFGTTSFFTIETQLGANIQRFSRFPNKREVLIPGYEIFKVVSFDKQSHSFHLTSKGRSKSRFNCAYFKRKE